MAAIKGDLAKLFPLKSTTDVVRFFRQHLETNGEPDLALLSIITGTIENTLTSKCVATTASSEFTNQTNAHDGGGNSSGGSTTNNTGGTAIELSNFPIVQLDTVQELYKKFKSILSTIDSPSSTTTGGSSSSSKHNLKQKSIGNSSSSTSPKYASREIIKKVSDIIWNSLIRSTYKDRAHLQSLYSYLAGNKLDCFGVAFAVVAGCQVLGYIDVHLAISEDHAWVVFGKTGTDTIEVTWHGKGTEDKRGQPVTAGYESHSWLYLSGNPVICNRYMEVAAIVSSINPSLNMTSACLEVADLQQKLLWLLYDMGNLKKYPMGLGCLGELEEVSATPDRPSCEILYAESVKASKSYYKNHHVYPYTYQGGYYYRQSMFKHAFGSWANAGDVIRLYNYSRDDEEIYKEFLDIANELIPIVMKAESSGHSAKSVLRDPQCFANLLRFYDGICQWEEGSQTPILHIGWAKPLVTTISRFDCDIRSQVIINVARDDEDVTKFTENESNNNNNTVDSSTTTTKTDDKSINNKDAVIPTLEALTAACGEKILNPDFLLQGGGQPFADQQISDNTTTTTQQSSSTNTEKVDEKLSPSPKNEESITTNDFDVKQTSSNHQTIIKSTTNKIESTGPVYEPNDDIIVPKRPEITLYSRKMKGIRDLLLAEKLNTHAISLQVTAQSQVQVGGKKGRSLSGSINYAKRSRRQ